jgi:hypothetical protein
LTADPRAPQRPVGAKLAREEAGTSNINVA